MIDDIDVLANKIRRFLESKEGLSPYEAYFVMKYVAEDQLADINNDLFVGEEEEVEADDDLYAEDEVLGEAEYEDELPEEPEMVESFGEMEEKAEEFLDEPGSEMEMPLEEIPERLAPSRTEALAPQTQPDLPVKKRGGGRPPKRVEELTKRGKLKEAGHGSPASDVIKRPKFLMREKKTQAEVDKGEY